MATEDKNAASNLIVGGFHFTSETDAGKAQMDLSKIKLLETRVKASRPADIKAVYDKAIENKIFKTPVGWGYLAGLKKRLLESGYKEEDIIPIPLEISFTRHSALEGLSVRQRIKPDENKNKDFRRIFPIILNIVLVIVVIIMFVIAVTGENDNIINYKSNVTNRYAAWEQDLKEREKAVRAAEKKLGIQDTSTYYEDTDISQED